MLIYEFGMNYVLKSVIPIYYTVVVIDSSNICVSYYYLYIYLSNQKKKISDLTQTKDQNEQ